MATQTIDELLQYQNFKTLKPEQVASFMKHGFLRLPGAISLEKCDWWTRDVWHRLGMDPEDKSTWTQERTHMARHNLIPAKEIAPVAWAAICELLGGEDRIAKGGEMWTDGFIVNFGSEEKQGQVIPPKHLNNWHVDGDFFVHFLDSPEQALLVIPCWSDIEQDGGATFICDEGPKRIGKLLYDHPEGLSPAMATRGGRVVYNLEKNPYRDEVWQAPDESFHEMVGNKGDVILMHPLMLHSASNNAKRAIRIITNPPVSLAAPFQFNRLNPAEYNLVELKTIQDLGGPEKFQGWKITGERELIVPERIVHQKEVVEKEKARLRKLGIETTDTPISQLPHLILSREQAAN